MNSNTTTNNLLCNALRKASHQRSPSPVGNREPSWLYFREAAALRKQAKTTWKCLIWALAFAQASVWAPTTAVPALLICALLGSRGNMQFEELCVIGGFHHFGVLLCGVLSRRCRSNDPGIAITLAGVSASMLAIAFEEGLQHRLSLFALSRLFGGAATRLVADSVLGLLNEVRASLTPFHNLDNRRCNIFGEETALRWAPVVGAASGFLFAFCLALPVAARADASSHHEDQELLPPRIGKFVAWYAGFRRSRDRVFHSNRCRPANCCERAIAARDAWRWCFVLLAIGCLVAYIVLRVANSSRVKISAVGSGLDSSTYFSTRPRTPRLMLSSLSNNDPSQSVPRNNPIASSLKKSPLEETGIQSNFQKVRASSNIVNFDEENHSDQQVEDDALDPVYNHQHIDGSFLYKRNACDRLVACAALCTEGALALYFFFGAVTLQVSLKLSPREAAYTLLLSYGLTFPIGTMLGACALAVVCSHSSRKKKMSTRRSIGSQQQAPRPPHTHLRCVELLLRDETTAPLDLFPVHNYHSVVGGDVSQPRPSIPRMVLPSQVALSSPSPAAKRSRKYLIEQQQRPPKNKLFEPEAFTLSHGEMLSRNNIEFDSSTVIANDDQQEQRSSEELEVNMNAEEETTSLAPFRMQQQLDRNRSRRRRACFVAIGFGLLALVLSTASCLTCARLRPLRTAGLGAASALVQIGVLPALALLEAFPNSALPATSLAALVRVFPFGLAALLSRTLSSFSQYSIHEHNHDVLKNMTKTACTEPAAPAAFRHVDRILVRGIWLFFLLLVPLCLMLALLCEDVPIDFSSVREYDNFENDQSNEQTRKIPTLRTKTSQHYTPSSYTHNTITTTDDIDLTDSATILRESWTDGSPPLSRHQKVYHPHRSDRMSSRRQMRRASTSRGRAKLINFPPSAELLTNQSDRSSSISTVHYESFAPVDLEDLP